MEKERAGQLTMVLLEGTQSSKKASWPWLKYDVGVRDTPDREAGHDMFPTLAGL